MKFLRMKMNICGPMSLPPRGAWIEILLRRLLFDTISSRSPRGERGLKSIIGQINLLSETSLPPRGAWIEIKAVCRVCFLSQSLPPRGAWIEIYATNIVFS